MATDMHQISSPLDSARDPFLSGLGERVRTLRARRGMTRKMLAKEAGVSERHLANLETGVGNASILVLRQLALALNCAIAEFAGEETLTSPEWLLIRQLLKGRDEQGLKQARQTLAELFGAGSIDPSRYGRIALIGLRGAGKSTLGRMLSDDLRVPFVELNRKIEGLAGCPVTEIYSLYGSAAYRRHELTALDKVIKALPNAVIATPGGLVSEPGTLNLLLTHCFTIWLQATPEDHMKRVIAQGDMRPMAGNKEAMDDLKRILAGRADFYAKADISFDTSERVLAEAYLELRSKVLLHYVPAAVEATG
jgi:XRE family aerobic/anaerobic benzoate catabolism transcriptional regulator